MTSEQYNTLCVAVLRADLARTDLARGNRQTISGLKSKSTIADKSVVGYLLHLIDEEHKYLVDDSGYSSETSNIRNFFYPIRQRTEINEIVDP